VDDPRTADLAAGEIRTADLAAGEIRTADLAAGEIRMADLAAGEIRTADLAAGEIRTADLAAGAHRAGDRRRDGRPVACSRVVDRTNLRSAWAGRRSVVDRRLVGRPWSRKACVAGRTVADLSAFLLIGSSSHRPHTVCQIAAGRRVAVRRRCGCCVRLTGDRPAAYPPWACLDQPSRFGGINRQR
jgi:hypothetical protein